MAGKTIKLSQPVEWGGAIVDSVTLREPTTGNYVAVGGKPFFPVYGSPEPVVDYDKMRAYLDLLVDHPGKYALVASMALEDGLAVERALLDFFSKRPATSGAPANSSSSA